MENRRERHLQQIVAMSRQMLEQARECNWGRVADLETERKALVDHCFRAPAVPQDAPGVAAHIREILRLNRLITELGASARDRLGNELRSHKAARSAAAAYSQNTG